MTGEFSFDLIAEDGLGRRGRISTAHGTVEKKVTNDTKIKGHQVRASKDEPQYIVESDNGGKAAHKAGALHKA